MPFKRIKRGKGRGKCRSPSGCIFSAALVLVYYATGGFKRPVRRKRR